MKRNMFVLPVLGLLFLLCQGCSEDKEENPTPESPSITVESGEDMPVFETAGGTAALTFTATSDWTASVDGAASGWLSVSPASGGAGTYTLSLVTTANDSYDERNASVTITSGSVKKTFTVTQKQKDALILTSNKVEVDAEGGDFSIELQANVEVAYEIEDGAQTWLAPVSRSRALASSALTFHAEANEESESRQGVIKLTGGNGLTEEVTVYQIGTGPALVLSQSEYIVSSAGETIQVELRSNTEYEIEMPAVDWLRENSSRSLSTYTHYFTVDPNETYDAREAVIRFVDEENGLKDSVNIVQVQKNAIILAKNKYEVSGTGETLNFSIQANVDFTVSANVDWITQNNTRGLTEYPLSFTISPNDNDNSRTGIITIADANNNRQEITVEQSCKVDYEKIEREALIAFYNATDGDHWKNNTNWCSDKPLDEWYGVRTESGCVFSLQLTDNSLKGEIPEEIIQLTHLQSLNLQLNSLSGEIPQDIGEHLSDLRGLILKNNQLTGKIPASLGNCPLHILDLFGNNLSGEVPDIFNTPTLVDIGLGRNQLTGSLPELGENVRNFRADGNQFSGSIPDSHINVLKYNEIYNISYNNLTGTVPQAMVTSDKFHIYWYDILPQNPGYGFEGEMELPAHTNTVKCYDGSSLNLGEEYAKNKYTLLFRWDPYCSFSYEYPEKIEQLRKEYEEKGLGILNMTLDKYSTEEIASLTAAMPETPVFWESWEDDNNPYTGCQHSFLFVFRSTPYFFLIDQTGNIIFFGSGEVYGDFIPQYHENRDELFDFIANLFGDEEFEPEETEYYTSTDYSRDGEVVTLQEASVGNGIDLVFMGEGFVDKDMGDGGLYEQKMTEGMEQFFAYEPYRSLRNRFNVYAVKVVSPNAEFAPGAEHRINESDAICFEYAQKIPELDQSPMVSVIYNNAYAGRSYTTMYTDGSFVGYLMEGVNDVLNHEAGGHGFANLADEYVEGGYENLILPESEKELMDWQWENFGWGANVDWRDDPNTVKWAPFLQDSRYANEGLGIYEGANLYGLGAYRPTENSMMRYNDSPFNAPSREQIYKRIMQMSEGSGWTYDYEDFVEFDASSRNAAASRSLRQAPSAAQIEKWRKNHRPPVRVKGTWRDARKNTITVPYR